MQRDFTVQVRKLVEYLVYKLNSLYQYPKVNIIPILSLAYSQRLNESKIDQTRLNQLVDLYFPVMLNLVLFKAGLRGLNHSISCNSSFFDNYEL